MQAGATVSAASFLEAIEESDLEKVKALLKSFPGLVSVKESGGWGNTALHKAVGEGNAEMVKLLLTSNAEVNAQNANHQSPLYDAVSGDREVIVKLLLARKAAVNSRNCVGDYTPLHNAKSRSVAELLIAHGADVRARTDNEDGSATPLHSAARNGRRDVAETLIAHGAEINARNKWGSTPLDVAQGNADFIEILRRHGGRSTEQRLR
jgi:ankyrin repeat protein